MGWPKKSLWKIHSDIHRLSYETAPHFIERSTNELLNWLIKFIDEANLKVPEPIVQCSDGIVYLEWFLVKENKSLSLSNQSGEITIYYQNRDDSNSLTADLDSVKLTNILIDLFSEMFKHDTI